MHHAPRFSDRLTAPSRSSALRMVSTDAVLQCERANDSTRAADSESDLHLPFVEKISAGRPVATYAKPPHWNPNDSAPGLFGKRPLIGAPRRQRDRRLLPRKISEYGWDRRLGTCRPATRGRSRDNRVRCTQRASEKLARGCGQSLLICLDPRCATALGLLSGTGHSLLALACQPPPCFQRQI
jgi:hypothetical protein